MAGGTTGLFDDMLPQQDGANATGNYTPPTTGMFDDMLPKQTQSQSIKPDNSLPKIPGTPEFDAEQKRLAAPTLKPVRPMSERIGDTAAFASSLPVRMLTGGDKGLGDWLRLAGLHGAADSISQGEADFANANQDELRALDKYTSILQAFPTGFHGMGYVPPASAIPSVAPYVDKPLISREYTTQATKRAEDAVRDQQAFRDAGVREFGPAFSQGPVASIAKQLEETPYIGSPLKNAADASLLGTAEYAQRVANNIGDATTPEQAGRSIAGGMGNALAETRDELTGLANNVAAPASDVTVGGRLKQGLDRFTGSGISDIEPGVLQGLNVTPNRAVPTQPNMSAGAAARAANAAGIRQQLGGGTAQTIGGAQVPMANPRTLTRTTAADLSDAELQRIAQAPAQQTSFRARQEALYEIADRSIPDITRANGSINPGLMAPVNLRAAIDGMRTNLGSEIAGTGVINDALAQRLQNNVTFDTLRQIRTAIGQQISDYNPLQSSLSQSQLRQLYAGVSRDIEVGLQDIANRAYQNTQLPPNNPAYVAPDVARQADNALYAFRRADRYTRQGFDRMDRFSQIMQTDNPQAAAQRLVDAANNGTAGNVQLLQTARAALRPDEWRDVSSYVLRQLGTPDQGATALEKQVGFSPSALVNNYSRMDPRARNLLFTPDVNARLGELVQRSQALDEVKRLYNVGSVENVYSLMAKDALDGTKGNIARLRTAISALGPEVRNDVASTMLAQMGKPVASARGSVQEIGFSPQTFTTNWQKLNPQARALLFDPAHAQSIDNLQRISNRLANVDAMRNVSRSGTNAMNLSGLAWIATALMHGDVVTPAGIVGGGTLLSYLLSRPAYAQWAVQYARARAAVSNALSPVGAARNLAASVEGLGRLASRDPNLIPAYAAIVRDSQSNALQGH